MPAGFDAACHVAGNDNSPPPPRFQRDESARHAILTSMRHWLAGALARERPALFRQLRNASKSATHCRLIPSPDPHRGVTVCRQMDEGLNKLAARQHRPTTNQKRQA
jgi:hypothetical protein